MADENKPGAAGNLSQDELVTGLVPDSNRTPDVRMLSGFLGKSAQDGYWRLYLTPELNEYIEFSAQDVVHSQRIDPSQSPLGGTVVWLRREANLTHSRSMSGETQADFLQGSITAAYLRGTRAGASLGLRAFELLRVGDTEVTVCKTCPHSDFAPVCTLATSCYTKVVTDPGCGGVIAF